MPRLEVSAETVLEVEHPHLLPGMKQPMPLLLVVMRDGTFPGGSFPSFRHNEGKTHQAAVFLIHVCLLNLLGHAW